MATVSVMAITIIHLLFVVTASLIQTIVKSVFQIAAGFKIINSLLLFEKMGIYKKPHTTITPIDNTLVIRSVVCQIRVHSAEIFFCHFNIMLSILILTL